MSKIGSHATWGSIGLQIIIAICLALTIWTCRSGQDKVREDTVVIAKAWTVINSLAAKTNTVSEAEDWKQLASALAHYGLHGTKAQEYDAVTYGSYLDGIRIFALSALGGIVMSICASGLALTRSKSIPA
jgi:hypothetical protein